MGTKDQLEHWRGTNRIFRELQFRSRSEEHTSELQSTCNLVCRLLLEKKKKKLIITMVAIKYELLKNKRRQIQNVQEDYTNKISRKNI